jgi:hypothetical protein
MVIKFGFHKILRISSVDGQVFGSEAEIRPIEVHT